MEIGRIVSTKLWEDEKVENFTPEEKYFWLFLLTNPKTSQLGIYQITYKTMAFYTGYDIETCKKLMDRLEKQHDMVRYIDGELAIKNFLMYGVKKGGKPVEDLLKKEIKQVLHPELLSWVFQNVKIVKCNETVKAIATSINDELVEIDTKQVQESDLDKTLKDFAIMRNRIKKPLTQRAMQLLKNKLAKMADNDETKIKILEQSIVHCWQDVYPLKDSKNVRNEKSNNELPTYDMSSNKTIPLEEAYENLLLMGRTKDAEEYKKLIDENRRKQNDICM